MKHIKRTVSVFAALALASGLSGAAYAAQTYLEEPASAGRSTGAIILALAVAVLMFAALALCVKLGRSGHINVPWAVLAVVFTGFGLLLSIIGYNAGALYSKPQGDPSETVTRFYDALIAGDYPTAYSCLSDYTGLGLETTPSSENAALIYDALKESYEYTLTGAAVTDGLTARQGVRFKYLDLSELEASVEDGVQRNLEKLIDDRPRSEVYDEHDKYLPSITEEAYSVSLTSVLSHADSYYTAAEITVELTYTGGQWLIVTNQTMLNALMGGAAY